MAAVKGERERRWVMAVTLAGTRFEQRPLKACCSEIIIVRLREIPRSKPEPFPVFSCNLISVVFPSISISPFRCYFFFTRPFINILLFFLLLPTLMFNLFYLVSSQHPFLLWFSYFWDFSALFFKCICSFACVIFLFPLYLLFIFCRILRIAYKTSI